MGSSPSLDAMHRSVSISGYCRQYDELCAAAAELADPTHKVMHSKAVNLVVPQRGAGHH